MKRVIAALVALLITSSAFADVTLDQDYLYDEVNLVGAGETYNAAGARWMFSNSDYEEPLVPLNTCRNESIVNRYPITMRSENQTLNDALITGRVSLDAPWDSMYGPDTPGNPNQCNAAAIVVQNPTTPATSTVTINRVRLNRVWDGIRNRSRRGAPAIINDCWISNARDDAFEFDGNAPITVNNCLVDGAFVGISLRPKDSNSLWGNTIVRNSAFRIRGHLHAVDSPTQFVSGNIIKEGSAANPIIYENVVVAYDTPEIIGNIEQWYKWMGDPAQGGDYGDKIQSVSGTNFLLWMHDDTPPPEFYNVHPGFSLLVGQAARDKWVETRCQWINANPNTRRITAEYADDRNPVDPITLDCANPADDGDPADGGTGDPDPTRPPLPDGQFANCSTFSRNYLLAEQCGPNFDQGCCPADVSNLLIKAIGDDGANISFDVDRQGNESQVCAWPTSGAAPTLQQVLDEVSPCVSSQRMDVAAAGEQLYNTAAGKRLGGLSLNTEYKMSVAYCFDGRATCDLEESAAFTTAASAPTGNGGLISTPEQLGQPPWAGERFDITDDVFGTYDRLAAETSTGAGSVYLDHPFTLVDSSTHTLSMKFRASTFTAGGIQMRAVGFDTQPGVQVTPTCTIGINNFTGGGGSAAVALNGDICTITATFSSTTDLEGFLRVQLLEAISDSNLPLDGVMGVDVGEFSAVDG